MKADKRGPLVEMADTFLSIDRRMRRNFLISFVVLVAVQIPFLVILALGRPLVGLLYLFAAGIYDYLFRRYQIAIQDKALQRTQCYLLKASIVHSIVNAPSADDPISEMMREHRTEATIKAMLGEGNGTWDGKGSVDEWRDRLHRWLCFAAYRRIPMATWDERRGYIALAQTMIAVEALRRRGLRERLAEWRQNRRHKNEKRDDQ